MISFSVVQGDPGHSHPHTPPPSSSEGLLTVVGVNSTASVSHSSDVLGLQYISALTAFYYITYSPCRPCHLAKLSLRAEPKRRHPAGYLFVKFLQRTLHSIEHLSRYSPQRPIDLMDNDETPFLESLHFLMELGDGGILAAHLEATVPPKYKPAFVQNQLSIPMGVLGLVRSAIAIEPDIVSQLVYGDFKGTVRCLYDLARSVSLGTLDWYVVSRLWLDSSILTPLLILTQAR